MSQTLLDSIDSDHDSDTELDDSDESPFVKNWGPGICCFCGFKCNFMSQCCGVCARNPPIFRK